VYRSSVVTDATELGELIRPAVSSAEELTRLADDARRSKQRQKAQRGGAVQLCVFCFTTKMFCYQM
jgi:hypothetical protein